MLSTRIHAKNVILLVTPCSTLAPGSYSESLAGPLFSHTVGSFKDAKALLIFLNFIFILLPSHLSCGKGMRTPFNYIWDSQNRGLAPPLDKTDGIWRICVSQGIITTWTVSYLCLSNNIYNIS